MSLDYPHRVFRRLGNGIVITVYYYAQGNKDYYAKKDGQKIGMWHTEGHPMGLNYSYGEIERCGLKPLTYHEFKEWLKMLEGEA